MPEEDAQLIRDVRSGKYTEDEAVRIAEDVSDNLKEAYDKSTLPERPDRDAIESWLGHAYHRFYRLEGN